MAAFLTALNKEWRELDRSPRARREVARWAKEFPALAGVRSPLDILRRRSEDEPAAPSILRALATLAPDNELASRALLHALMPGIVRLSKEYASRYPGALEEIVALAWERIRTYPRQRPGSVAANVLRDVRKRYIEHIKIDHPVATHDDGCIVGERQARSAEDEVLASLSLAQVVDTVRRSAYTETDFEVFVETWLLDVPIAEVARRRQAKLHTLVTRRWRTACRTQRQLKKAS